MVRGGWCASEATAAVARMGAERRCELYSHNSIGVRCPWAPDRGFTDTGKHERSTDTRHAEMMAAPSGSAADLCAAGDKGEVSCSAEYARARPSDGTVRVGCASSSSFLAVIPQAGHYHQHNHVPRRGVSRGSVGQANASDGHKQIRQSLGASRGRDRRFGWMGLIMLLPSNWGTAPLMGVGLRFEAESS